MDLIYAIIAAAGIPSAVMGLINWRLQKKLEKRDRDREEQERNREKLDLLMVQACNAAIALSEATARAMERIPDAHCNGDMHEALAYAKEVKRSIKQFLEEQGVKAVVK